MPFTKRMGEVVSNWVGHPAEAVVMASVTAIAVAVFLACLLPWMSWAPAVATGVLVFCALMAPYWLLRRHGLLEPDVPFTFGTSDRPALLTVHRLLMVYITGRLNTGQKRFGMPELCAVVYKIISAQYSDGEPVFRVYGSSDRAMTDVEETQVLSTLRLFVLDGQMYEESGLYTVTVKGELIFRSSAKAAYETDESTIALICDELGLDCQQITRLSST